MVDLIFHRKSKIDHRQSNIISCFSPSSLSSEKLPPADLIRPMLSPPAPAGR
jgi:hypothetical protein